MPTNESVAALNLDEYKYGFHDEVDYVYKSRKGLDEEIVREISGQKNEPEWMLKHRLKALKHAHLGHGRAWACLSALRRVWSIHSGSPFCALISRTISSSSPLRLLKT